MNTSKPFSPVRASRLWRLGIIAVMVVAALAIRIYDLNDPPFDFHPTRQFFTAIVARGEYYQGLETAPAWMRDQAAGRWQSEETDFPSIDLLAAWTYRLIGHEDLFYPRLYSVLFWVLGGLAVFLLGRSLVSFDGGIVALAFYLFVPYGIIASRSFQPDPLMVCLILFAWWGMLRWKDTDRWRWVVVAGLLAAAAMLVKALAAFSLLGGMAGVFFAAGARRSLRSPRFWVMGIIAAVPMLAWVLYGFFGDGGLGSQFSLRFFPSLWIDPLFYLRMEGKVETVVGLIPVILALLGIFLYQDKGSRTFLVALWGGYLVYAFVFAYYFMTHDYYHITLIPITALALAPLGDLLIRRLGSLNPGRLARGLMAVIVIAGLGANLWNLRQVLHKTDYRPQAAVLEHVGQVVGTNVSVVALTSDYGYPLFFYSWLPASYWPHTGDTRLRQLAGMPAPDFNSLFAEMTLEKQYFIVTDLEEYALQPALSAHLSARYPVFDQGQGYIIYDLLHPLETP